MTDSQPPSRPRAGDRSRLVVLKYRDFRLLWGGELLSMVGTQMQLFAVNWQVLQLLRHRSYLLSFAGMHLSVKADALGLGALGLVRVVPILLLAMFGGALADAHDRRRVITLAQAAAALNAALLAMLSFSGHASLAALYGLSAIGVSTSVFAQPAQQALVPPLVAREHLSNAYSLYALIWQAGSLIGPPLAGLIIAQAGFGMIYAIDAASFVTIVMAVRAIRYRADAVERERPDHLTAMREGWRFARGTTLVWQTLLIDLYATFFASARAMVPLIAANVLHVGVRGYGLLASAQPIGASIAGVVLTLRRDIAASGDNPVRQRRDLRSRLGIVRSVQRLRAGLRALQHHWSGRHRLLRDPHHHSPIAHAGRHSWSSRGHPHGPGRGGTGTRRARIRAGRLGLQRLSGHRVRRTGDVWAHHLGGVPLA